MTKASSSTASAAWCATAARQIDHIDNKRYNIAPSLTWNIDDDTKFTLLTQFTRDDTGITSQFQPIQGTKIDMPFGDISHHKNLGDPDCEYYDRTYYALGYAFEHRLNDVWQFRQNLRYTKSDLSFQALTVGAYSVLPRSTTKGNVGRTTNVDEDISQFAVDNNFQADFATGDIRHTLLLGLDHQRSNTNYTVDLRRRPDHQRQQPDLRPADRSSTTLRLRSMTTTRRPIRPVCTSRTRWPSTNGA